MILELRPSKTTFVKRATMVYWNKSSVFILSTALICAMQARAGFARTRLQDICTVYGQQEVQLVGMGLVVGLNGTGDAGKSAVAQRALMAMLKNMNAPASEKELRDAKNVALVSIQATIPKQGLRRGQTIDCFVSSIGGAKSLRGGRLMPAPLGNADRRDKRPLALAKGGIRIVSGDSLTTGEIKNGVVLQQNFTPPIIDTKRNHILTLMLDANHQSFPLASDIANSLNQWLSPDGITSSRQLAKAISEGVIEVQLPPEYRDDPVAFVGWVLSMGIDAPQSQSRVLVDTRTKQIVISGEVEISPVVAYSKSLTVEIGGAGAARGGRFIPVMDPKLKAQQGSQSLNQLVAALNQLQAPPEEVIDIIRMINDLGKLHAVYEER